MKTRSILIAIAFCLFLGSFALRQGFGSPLPTRSATDPGVIYTITGCVLTGGEFSLQTTGWRIQGETAAASYHLQALSAPTGTGTPCCCSFLPAIRR